MEHSVLSPAGDLLVDLADLLNPATTVGVLQRQYVFQWPVEVVRDVGYLLVEAVQGVAYDPPWPSAVSTWNLVPHSGQDTVTSVLAFSLIRRYSVCK